MAGVVPPPPPHTRHIECTHLSCDKTDCKDLTEQAEGVARQASSALPVPPLLERIHEMERQLVTNYFLFISAMS